MNQTNLYLASTAANLTSQLAKDGILPNAIDYRVVLDRYHHGKLPQQGKPTEKPHYAGVVLNGDPAFKVHINAFPTYSNRDTGKGSIPNFQIMIAPGSIDFLLK